MSGTALLKQRENDKTFNDPEIPALLNNKAIAVEQGKYVWRSFQEFLRKFSVRT
jgi:hypothetical protein